MCDILQNRGHVTKGGGNVPTFGNAYGHGYYRSEYEQTLRDQLTKQLETGLLPTERISMLGDEWALMHVGRLAIGNYLDLVSQLKGERLRQVWQGPLGNIDYINDVLITDQERDHLRRFVRNLMKPVYTQLANSSDPEEKALRADLFYRLGIIGRDPDVMAEARQIAQKVLQDSASADPLFAGPALEIAATAGDEKLFSQTVDALKGTDDQILRRRYMDALSRFEKPELEEKALELGVSGAIRNQDSTAYLARFLRYPATRPVAWKFIQTHWNDVEKTFTTASGSALVSSAGTFCDADAESSASGFFKVHPVPAAERTLRQTLERINSCVDLRKMQENNLQSWLVEHASGGAAAGGN
jgi:aminopeptidase N